MTKNFFLGERTSTCICFAKVELELYNLKNLISHIDYESARGIPKVTKLPKRKINYRNKNYETWYNHNMVSRHLNETKNVTVRLTAKSIPVRA